jgi:hypothetical protein
MADNTAASCSELGSGAALNVTAEAEMAARRQVWTASRSPVPVDTTGTLLTVC